MQYIENNKMVEDKETSLSNQFVYIYDTNMNCNEVEEKCN